MQAAIVKGQPAGLEQLSTAYRPALVSFFVRRVHSLAEAEDMTQELFMRLARTDLKTIEAPESYLFRMASNLVRDRARYASRQFRLKHDFGEQPGVGVESIDPERIAQGHDMLRHLDIALSELPERSREIFILYRIENIATKVIAAQYGISVSAAEKHIRRAMRYIIRRLEDEA